MSGERCICDAGFGMNLSCPAHNPQRTDTPREPMAELAARLEQTQGSTPYERDGSHVTIGKERPLDPDFTVGSTHREHPTRFTQEHVTIVKAYGAQFTKVAPIWALQTDRPCVVVSREGATEELPAGYWIATDGKSVWAIAADFMEANYIEAGTPAPVSGERVEGRGICSECGEPTDGTDHNPACMMERVADLLDEYRSSGDGSTRTGDFIWADRLLLLVRTPSGAAPRLSRTGEQMSTKATGWTLDILRNGVPPWPTVYLGPSSEACKTKARELLKKPQPEGRYIVACRIFDPLGQLQYVLVPIIRVDKPLRWRRGNGKTREELAKRDLLTAMSLQ